MRLISLFIFAMLMAPAQDGPPPGRASLRERASNGDADAQFTLGKNYEAGRGGLKKDFEQASNWYRLAADQGDPFAQASLGLLYRFGKGVQRDLVQAYLWLELSASRTTGADSESIAEYRDAAAAQMTQAQINEAKRLARGWKPKPMAR